MLTVFRHLVTLRLTVDGNHHLNRYMKNSDRSDRSLLDGRAIGYFPKRDIYRGYLNGIPVTKEVCPLIPMANLMSY